MNMSLDLKIKNQQLKLLQENNFLFPDEDCNIIIPYLPSGYEDYSNNGYVQGQKLIDNYLTYKRIWTGNDAFTITWKGSTHIKKDLDSDGNLQIGWQLGEYILGYNESHYSSVDITDDSAFSDYKKTVAENTITFRIRADKYDLNENYKYMFYKVPEISKEIVFRVVSLDTEYIGRIKVCYVLTLKSLQQELENTGRAKQQNIMNSAPGSGYYDPIIIESDTPPTVDYLKVDATRYITFDTNKWINDPIKYVVVKQFGLSVLCSFTMMGRKITETSNMTTYGLPRLVFPINFTTADTPTLYRTQKSENNYYWLSGAKVNIQFTQKAYDGMKDFFDVDKTWTNQGIVEFNAADVEKSNKKVNNVFPYSLYGSATNVNNFLVYKPWKFDIGRVIEYDSSGVMGCENKTYMTGTNRPIHDYMWAAYWNHKAYTTLPIGIENTVTFGDMIGGGLQTIMGGGLKNVITGSILSAIGLVGSMVSKVAAKNMKQGFSGLISAKLLDFMYNEASISLPNMIANENWFKLSYLMNSEENDFIKFFNTSTMNTSFKAELTDLFVKDGKQYETLLIGQTKDKNGNNVLSNGKPLLVNGNESLAEIQQSNIGFIIDSFNLQSVFMGDFSVEFLNSKEEIVWSGVYQSQGKWTGSIRDWNTWKNTSIYGRENIFLEEPVAWPAYPTYDDVLVGGGIDITLNQRLKLFHTAEWGSSFNQNNYINAFPNVGNETNHVYTNTTTNTNIKKDFTLLMKKPNESTIYKQQSNNVPLYMWRAGDKNNNYQVFWGRYNFNRDGNGVYRQTLFTNTGSATANEIFDIYKEFRVALKFSDRVETNYSININNWNKQDIQWYNQELGDMWSCEGGEYNGKYSTADLRYYKTSGNNNAHSDVSQNFLFKHKLNYGYKIYLEIGETVDLVFELSEITLFINDITDTKQNLLFWMTPTKEFNILNWNTSQWIDLFKGIYPETRNKNNDSSYFNYINFGRNLYGGAYHNYIYSIGGGSTKTEYPQHTYIDSWDFYNLPYFDYMAGVDILRVKSVQNTKAIETRLSKLKDIK